MTTDNEILIRMNALVMDILELEGLSLERDMTAREVEGWDSLAHINIIVAMENEFGVKLKLAEVKTLKNIGDFIDLVKAKTQ
jgi:acyl carrier protein